MPLAPGRMVGAAPSIVAVATLCVMVLTRVRMIFLARLENIFPSIAGLSVAAVPMVRAQAPEPPLNPGRNP